MNLGFQKTINVEISPAEALLNKNERFEKKNDLKPLDLKNFKLLKLSNF